VPRLMFIAMVAGLVSGLLVGGFHNLFTVPVIERAIVLEEEQAAAETVLVEAGNDHGSEISQGVQRVGLVVGTGLYAWFWASSLPEGIPCCTASLPAGSHWRRPW